MINLTRTFTALMDYDAQEPEILAEAVRGSKADDFFEAMARLQGLAFAVRQAAVADSHGWLLDSSHTPEPAPFVRRLVSAWQRDYPEQARAALEAWKARTAS